jgi:hypothetical protein
MATPPEGTANARDEDHLNNRSFFMNKKEVARLGAKTAAESQASGVDFKERNKKIIELRKTWTLEKIAIFFGMSRQRVQQIIGTSKRVEKHFSFTKAVNMLYLDPTKTKKEMQSITGRRIINWFGMRHPLEGKNQIQGYEAEEYVSRRLLELGIQNTLTNSRPIDIVLDNGIKIEVKSRTKPHPNKYSDNLYFFPLAKDVKKNIADFYILVIYEDCFVIPSSDIPVHGGIGFVWPKTTSKVGKFSNWTEYHNRFDLLK